ncbi:MAG: DNA-directed RNA polymerase subunit omega [bacterium]
MKDKKIMVDRTSEASKFQLVLAAAKRSKQINFMAKERGLPPNQVATIKTKHIKPPTIALMEIVEGRVESFYKNGEDPLDSNEDTDNTEEISE